MIKGKYNEKIVLRKNDEMQNLSNLFNEVIENTASRFMQLKKSSTDEERELLFKKIEF